MGPQRNDEDLHRGGGPAPKVRLAGRIDALVDGRPVTLVAARNNLELTVARWSTLVAMRRRFPGLIRSLRGGLQASDIGLSVRIGWFGRVRVHPNPPLLVRLLLPVE